MKKVLFVTAIVASGIAMYSTAILVGPDPESNYPYKGPSDEAVTDPLYYDSYTRNDTTFGQLAKVSDIIAFGQVVTQDWKSVTIQVEASVVGCTNGQFVTINKWGNDVPEEDHRYLNDNYMDSPNWNMYLIENYPTNNAQVVFSVYSNYYGWVRGDFDWNGEQSTNMIRYTKSTYRLMAGVRSWWAPSRDEGILTEHFTNVVQAVRIERNWTNYFYACRDGMYKDSIRVKEDSFYDMRGIIKNANKNQAHFIYNDPLVLPEHKAYLLELKPYIGE